MEMDTISPKKTWNKLFIMIRHKKNTMLSLSENPYNSKTFQNQDESLVFPSYKWSSCI